MCYQFSSTFTACTHEFTVDEKCVPAIENELDITQCENFTTIFEPVPGFCKECDAKESAGDDVIEQLKKSTRPKWQQEFLDDSALKRLSQLKFGEEGNQADEVADIQKVMRQSVDEHIRSQIGNRSIEDYSFEPSWTRRPGIDDQKRSGGSSNVAESSRAGAARNSSTPSQLFVSIPSIRPPRTSNLNKKLPPLPGPAPNRPLPPIPLSPTAPSTPLPETPPSNPGKQKAGSMSPSSPALNRPLPPVPTSPTTSSKPLPMTPPRNPAKQKAGSVAWSSPGAPTPPTSPSSAGSPRYSLFPPPTPPGRPSDAPDLVRGTSSFQWNDDEPGNDEDRMG